MQLFSPGPGPDGHKSGPLQGYNLFLELTSLEFRVVHTDTWRYEDGEHSATPPFSVLGVATEPYMSHDRRARCITEKQLRVYPCMQCTRGNYTFSKLDVADS